MSHELTIGELAAWAGTTVRTIRHYHRLGVLPEPPRRANGYRAYGLADLARLLRARRLAGLGVPLAELPTLLDGDPAGERLRDLLARIDADLAEAERRIGEQRAQIAALVTGAAPGVQDGLERLRHDLAAALGNGDALARELDVLEVVVHERPESFPRFEALYRGLLTDQDAVQRFRELARRFEALATADPDDPATAVEVTAVAGELARTVRSALQFQDGDPWGDAGAAGSPEADAARAGLVEGLARAAVAPAQGLVLAQARELLEGASEGPLEGASGTARPA